MRSAVRGRGRWRYTVGEGEAASFAVPPVDPLTRQGFELARGGPDGTAWIRFTAEMVGEIIVGDQRHTLQQRAPRSRSAPHLLTQKRG